jgi:hypothetical protein
MKPLKTLLAATLLAATTAAQTGKTLPPAGTKTVLTLQGTGTQIYTCKATPTPTWTFIAPQAKLLHNGKEIGTHSAGPTWALKDGSYIKGKVLVTQPSPDPAAVPWLLLQTTETHGKGALTPVQYIRRSNTKGGKAPTTGCDAYHLGANKKTPYTATYTFYGASQ